MKNLISYSQELFNHTMLSIKFSKRKKGEKGKKLHTLSHCPGPVTVAAVNLSLCIDLGNRKIRKEYPDIFKS